MQTTITRLSELRTGDVILSLDGRPYRKPLRVTVALGPIEPGSPVQGVRVESPSPRQRHRVGAVPLAARRPPIGGGALARTSCNPITVNSTIRVTIRTQEEP